MFTEDEIDKLPGGQTLSGLRSRVLLGILADDEVARLELPQTREQLERMALVFRRDFHMPARADVEQFLRFARLDLRDFSSVMRTFANVLSAQEHHRDAIEARRAAHVGLARIGEFEGTR